jgi:hypothetical protein
VSGGTIVYRFEHKQLIYETTAHDDDTPSRRRRVSDSHTIIVAPLAAATIVSETARDCA